MPPFIRLSTRQKVTIARLLNRCVKLGRSALRRPMHGQFRRGGLNWQLDLNEGIDFAIYLLGAFERDLVQSYRQLIAPGATVLDIGANIGAHTLPLAKHVGPNGRVVAIEATAYAKLQKTYPSTLNSSPKQPLSKHCSPPVTTQRQKPRFSPAGPLSTARQLMT